MGGWNVSRDRAANGYRLPTKAEWEYACRAGIATPFHTETSIGPEEANYHGRYPYMIEDNYFSQDNLEASPGQYLQTTVAVDSFQPNSLGLYNMHGNVGEWVWDYYGPYSIETQTDPAGPSTGTLRVSRGGEWNDFGKHLRSAYRASTPQANRSYNLGFRLVCNAADATGMVGTTGGIAAGRQTEVSNILVDHFSWGGNTKGIAEQIQQKTGADLFEIELVTPCSTNYNTVLDEAQQDQNNHARPELRTHVENMEQYDTILLGYPNWWASIPMPIASFWEEYDFAGKTVIPFCSHSGGRFGQSLTAIAKLAPDAVIAEGLEVSYSGGADLPDRISVWLDQNRVEEQ